MTTNAVVVGGDVAKDRLDVAVRPSRGVWSEANDDARVRALVALFAPARSGPVPRAARPVEDALGRLAGKHVKV
jgi:hypothetical protein